MRVALISLEPWDQVWRRNQYLVSELVKQHLVSHVVFVEPPRHGVGLVSQRSVAANITIATPVVTIPKRAGGLRLTGATIQRTISRHVDVLWVNDPGLGLHCLRRGQPAVYDVTDDWRSYDFPPRVLRRLVRSEDRLATRARTVVCSHELKTRWADRYGVAPTVVHNGVDVSAWQSAARRALPGAGPHVGYIGTIQPERLDIDLLVRLARTERIGTIHLVGPDALNAAARSALTAEPRIMMHGPVASIEVPSWTKSMDVLVSPHVVSPFTLSLDAIKSYEYLASGRPVVATPTSGFQVMSAPSLTVAAPADFVDGVIAALAPTQSAASGISWSFGWDERARAFAQELRAAGGEPA